MKRSRINPINAKRRQTNRAYAEVRKRFLLAHQRCQCLKPTGRPCGALATELHHRKGRGRFLLAEEGFMALCHQCHAFIEKHTGWAHRMEYLLNRASPAPIPPLTKIFLPYEPTDHTAGDS